MCADTWERLASRLYLKLYRGRILFLTILGYRYTLEPWFLRCSYVFAPVLCVVAR